MFTIRYYFQPENLKFPDRPWLARLESNEEPLICTLDFHSDSPVLLHNRVTTYIKNVLTNLSTQRKYKLSLPSATSLSNSV